MPRCNRCERVRPTAELRRTLNGFVCLDFQTWTSCYKLAQAAGGKRASAARAAVREAARKSDAREAARRSAAA